MSYNVGKGKLWLDGSGRVSVPVTFDSDEGIQKVKLLLGLEDTGPADAWERFTVMCNHGVPEGLNEKLALRVLQSADHARKDPKQLQALDAAMKRTVKGAKKSRAALQQRILTKKEVAFKKSVQDMMQRGATKNQLFQLVRDAIVEGVMEK